MGDTERVHPDAGKRRRQSYGPAAEMVDAGEPSAIADIQRDMEALADRAKRVGMSDSFFAEMMAAHKNEMISQPRCDWNWAKVSMQAVILRYPLPR